MARPVDVEQMTADIEKAEKDYKKNPATKDQLAKAYFVRATALDVLSSVFGLVNSCARKSAIFHHALGFNSCT